MKNVGYHYFRNPLRRAILGDGAQSNFTKIYMIGRAHYKQSHEMGCPKTRKSMFWPWHINLWYSNSFWHTQHSSSHSNLWKYERQCKHFRHIIAYFNILHTLDCLILRYTPVILRCWLSGPIYLGTFTCGLSLGQSGTIIEIRENAPASLVFHDCHYNYNLTSTYLRPTAIFDANFTMKS